MGRKSNHSQGSQNVANQGQRSLLVLHQTIENILGRTQLVTLRYLLVPQECLRPASQPITRQRRIWSWAQPTRRHPQPDSASVRLRTATSMPPAGFWKQGRPPLYPSQVSQLPLRMPLAGRHQVIETHSFGGPSDGLSVLILVKFCDIGKICEASAGTPPAW